MKTTAPPCSVLAFPARAPAPVAPFVIPPAPKRRPPPPMFELPGFVRALRAAMEAHPDVPRAVWIAAARSPSTCPRVIFERKGYQVPVIAVSDIALRIIRLGAATDRPPPHPTGAA